MTSIITVRKEEGQKQEEEEKVTTV